MKLSMWILSDWLKKYNPDNKINEGEQILRGVRLFSSDVKFENQNVYLGVAKDFIPSDSENIICINGHDMILLKTTDMEAVLNDVFDAFDFYYSWADGLVSDIYEGCSLQHLVDKSHEVFLDPITLHDAGNVLTAHSKEFGLGTIDKEWDTIITTKSMSLDSLHMMREHLHEIRFTKGVMTAKLKDKSPEFMLRNLFLNQKNMGRLVVVEVNNPITKGRLQLVESFGNIIEAWLKLNSSRKEMLEENQMFIDLLNGNEIIKEQLFKKIDVLGWKPGHKKIILAINNLGYYSEIHRPMLNTLEKNLSSCFLMEYKDDIIILANTDLLKEKRLIEIISPILKKTSSFCGISYEFYELLNIKDAYEQAALTLTHCPKEIGEIYFCKDYALKFFYNSIKSNVNHNIIHPELLKLLDYDSINNSDLFKTLYEFLKHERNLVKTANILNVHRNTLVYRINKINQVTSIDLDNPDTRAYLTLSFILIREP